MWPGAGFKYQRRQNQGVVLSCFGYRWVVSGHKDGKVSRVVRF